MINYVFIDAAGHKVARRINSREEYFKIRNSADNKKNFLAARDGDGSAKLKLKQFNYNDQLPDGVLKGCHTAASTFSHDIDCHSKEECQKIAQKILDMKEDLGLLELSTSPNHGLHPVCSRKLGKTILENQVHFSLLTKTEMDTNAHDQQRVMFTGPADEDTLLFLDDRIFEESLSVEEGQEEHERLKEREANGEEEVPAGAKKSDKHYKPWEDNGGNIQPSTQLAQQVIPTTSAIDPNNAPKVFGILTTDIINTMLPKGAPVGQRHPSMLKLANDFIILLDNDTQLVKESLLKMEWVRDVIKKRGEKELDDVVDSAKKLLKKRESENYYPPQPSREIRRVIEQLAHKKYNQLVAEARANQTEGGIGIKEDITEVLERIGREIEKLFKYYPLIKLLCHGLKRRHYVAALFVGGCLLMTLMTRCWYKFWSEPGRQCRLNSILELIGRSGSGKHIAVDLYKLLMLPVKAKDATQIDDLNAWNQEKEQKGGSDKNKKARPTGIFRCMPSETSAAAIREAEFYSKEVVDGVEWPLHVFQFNSELDDLLNQQKKGYMQIENLFLKSLHNEPAGAYLKSTNTTVGEFDVHFNGLYTGTEDAMIKQNTPANFARGLLQRIAAIPMGDSNFEMRENREYTAEDLQRDMDLRDWSKRLDNTKGEIPCKDISDALFKWTARRMEDAKDENSLALEDLVKRPCWHAINYTLPFVVSRHWQDMIEDDGKIKCGPNFKTDKVDIKLALLIVNAHFAFQQFFFLATGEKLYDVRQIEAASNHHPHQKSMLAYRRLPDPFTIEDIKREFGYGSINSVNSKLKRLQDDGLAQKIRTGEDKGKFRKLQ